MSVREFLIGLSQKGIGLRVEDDKLRVQAGKGVLTPELRDELSARKEEILVFLRSHQSTADASPAPPDAASPTGLIPLSPGQERLWFLDRMSPGTPLYNVHVGLRLRGPLDREVLLRSLAEIVRRHEVLRTRLPEIDGEPRQVIAVADAAMEFPVTDLRELSEEERELALLRCADAHGQAPFDLAQGPLFRADLVMLGSDEVVLLVTQHHTVTDGWSIGVFVQELAASYRAFSRGQPSPLPPLPMQYADVALRQRAWLKGEPARRERAYWKERLAGLSVLQLHTSRPIVGPRTYRGASASFALPKALKDELDALASRAGCSLFMVLIAGFAVLLHRHSRQEDFGVGTVVANRGSGQHGLLGFFSNTLVLRFDLSGEPSFEECLARVRKVVWEAFDHEELPFNEVVNATGARRDGGLNPLVQACFTMENLPLPDLEIPGVKWIPMLHSPDGGVGQMAKFDLGLVMTPANGGLYGVFEYSTDLFDADVIARMTGHFQTLLQAFAADPRRPITVVPLLSNEERRTILVEWNDTAADFPREACIHDLFEAQVRRTPSAVALIGGREAMTYTELEVRANRLAHHLQRLGVRPGICVGLCVERSIDMVVGMLGILKAGGAYVPLDPAYPEGRLKLILEDAEAPVLLTQQRLLESIPAHTSRLLCLDADWATIEAERADAPSRSATSLDVAYLIYTSGSTGRPKGVMIEHRNFVAFSTWARSAFDASDLAGMLASTSICFDLSTFEIFVPLCWGGTVVLAQNVLELPSLPAAGLVKLINTVPSAMAALLDAGGIPRTVRTVNLAGEALMGPLVERIYQLGHIEQVFNLYGPSETTTYSTYGCVEAGSAPTIGRPIANTQVFVLGQGMQPVPIGVPGELYIGGAGVARGYLNRPELTDERFLPSPLSDEAGARLYKTGDLARFRPDGELEYLGRLDHQVKIRGFRIELGEIESALSQHPGVRDAVVSVREDIPGDKRLIAYVVPNVAMALETGELRSHLKRKLPEHMIPSAFVMLASMPLTPNGKVDRKSLPAPDGAQSRANEERVPPRDSDEATLAAIWCEALEVERVGVHDSFFELGGHSLLLYRVLSRIRAAFRVDIPVHVVFHAPTIAELSHAIRSAKAGAAIVTRAPDLDADAVLDRGITPLGGSKRDRGEPRVILLTGATGFLGAFLLDELCRRTQATVYCLVRGADEPSCMRRIVANLEAYGLWEESLSSRIIAIPGDIEKPLLGIGELRFQRLAEEVDAIYHNGASVNFVYPYEMLKAANVLGTQEILRLATRAGVTPLHYISTVSVLPAGAESPIGEDDPLGSSSSILGGYAQSKWVAEKLVRAAQARGLPVCIYRPGRITGHSRTGAWNTDDLTCRMIKGCIQMGIAPALTSPMDLTPVDYASRAIVTLSRKTESIGRTYHIVSPHLVTATWVWSQLCALGYSLKVRPYEAWLDVLSAEASAPAANALASLLPVIQALPPEDRTAAGPRLVRCDCQRVLSALADMDVVCPPPDAALLSVYVAALVRRGFIDPPTGS